MLFEAELSGRNEAVEGILSWEAVCECEQCSFESHRVKNNFIVVDHVLVGGTCFPC